MSGFNWRIGKMPGSLPGRWLAMLLMAFSISVNLAAQGLTIKGVVTDAKTGEALLGANIMVKGTTNGVITDPDGNYQITTQSADAELVFSYIGYEAMTVAVNGRTRIDVSLTEDATALEEVLVIGYGTSKKKDPSGSISTMKREAIKD